MGPLVIKPHWQCVQVCAFCVCVSVHKARSTKEVVFHQVSSCNTMTEPLNQKVMEKSKHTKPPCSTGLKVGWIRIASRTNSGEHPAPARICKSSLVGFRKQGMKSSGNSLFLQTFFSEKQFYRAAMLIKKETAIAAIARTVMLCLGRPFDPAQNPQSFMPPDDDALSPVKGTGLKKGSVSKGPQICDTGSTLETPCGFIKRGLCFTSLLEHVEFYCQRKGFCNQTDDYIG